MLITKIVFIADIDLDPTIVRFHKYNPAKWPMPPGVRLLAWEYDPCQQGTLLRIEYDQQAPPPFKAIAEDDGTIDVEFTIDRKQIE